MKVGWAIALMALAAAIALFTPVRAAFDVELFGRIVSLDRSALTIETDGVQLALDVSEIDPRFVGSLRAGDDIKVAAFRLGDGSLYVYGLFLEGRDAPAERPKPPPDESE